jgi:hypothetical protein
MIDVILMKNMNPMALILAVFLHYLHTLLVNLFLRGRISQRAGKKEREKK